MKDKKIIFGITLAFIFLASVGFSYAYFTSSIVNNEVKDQVVKTGTLSLRYVDGAEIVMQNIKPGDTITKTVYVANAGTLDTSYNLVWQKLTNEITNDEMLIEGTCTRMNATTEAEDGTCEGITSTSISTNKIKKGVSIELNIVHKYDLIITFKEINNDQNYNQGKNFSGIIGIAQGTSPDPVSFKTDSWNTIVDAAKENNIGKYNLGDTKEIDLGALGTHTIRVSNISTPEECSTEGFSQTACGLVLEFTDIITTHKMNESNTNKGGYASSLMRTYLNEDIYNLLPVELQKGIMDTTVVSSHGNTSGEENFTSTDKIYLLSTSEVWAPGTSNTITQDTSSSLTRQLDYYKSKNVNTNNFSEALKKNGTTASAWWLRSSTSANSNYFLGVNASGDWNSNNAFNASGVSPAFRIG